MVEELDRMYYTQLGYINSILKHYPSHSSDYTKHNLEPFDPISEHGDTVLNPKLRCSVTESSSVTTRSNIWGNCSSCVR